MTRYVWRTLCALTLGVVAGFAPVGPASAAASGAAANGAAAEGLAVTARFAVRDAGGAALTIVGRYSCGPFAGGVPDRGVIDMTVTQTVAGADVTGFGYLTPTVCDGQWQRYTAQVTAVAGGYRRGAARWSASGYVEGSTGLQNVFVPPTRITVR